MWCCHGQDSTPLVDSDIKTHICANIYIMDYITKYIIVSFNSKNGEI